MNTKPTNYAVSNIANKRFMSKIFSIINISYMQNSINSKNLDLDFQNNIVCLFTSCFYVVNNRWFNGAFWPIVYDIAWATILIFQLLSIKEVVPRLRTFVIDGSIFDNGNTDIGLAPYIGGGIFVGPAPFDSSSSFYAQLINVNIFDIGWLLIINFLLRSYSSNFKSLILLSKTEIFFT